MSWAVPWEKAIFCNTPTNLWQFSEKSASGNKKNKAQNKGENKAENELKLKYRWGGSVPGQDTTPMWGKS